MNEPQKINPWKIEFNLESDPLKRFMEMYPEHFQIQVLKIKDIVDVK